MRKGLQRQWEDVLDHVYGKRHKADRKRTARSQADKPADDGPLDPHAPPPPGMTRRRCSGGPECVHTATRFVCACDWADDSPEDPPPRHCRTDKALAGCHTCPQCEWEKVATLWYEVSPWNKQLFVHRERQHPFASVDDALIAFAEWERHDRWGPSAMGPLISKLEAGQVGSGSGVRRDDPLMARATDVVTVRNAVERAYAGNNALDLSPVTCRVMLVARVGGVLTRLPSWDDMAEVFAVPKARIKSVVYEGRRGVTIELAAREVVPMPPREQVLHWEISVRRMELGRDSNG